MEKEISLLVTTNIFVNYTLDENIIPKIQTVRVEAKRRIQQIIGGCQ